jgi:hypothetical protein
MTSVHIINNNLRSNEWEYDTELGIWTNKYGYNVKHTGKIFHEGKEIYFPISCETEDDLEGRALRIEYTGDGNASRVLSNKWHSFDEQYCHRQKHLTKKRNKRTHRRRKQCKENDFQLEKEHYLKKQDENNKKDEMTKNSKEE